MANLNVTYDEISSVANQLQTGQGLLEDQLTTLKRAVDGLIGAGFATDQASGAFQNSYTEFDIGIRQIIGGIEGMSAFLSQAVTSYSQVDADLASAIKG